MKQSNALRRAVRTINLTLLVVVVSQAYVMVAYALPPTCLDLCGIDPADCEDRPANACCSDFDWTSERVFCCTSKFGTGYCCQWGDPDPPPGGNPLGCRRYICPSSTACPGVTNVVGCSRLNAATRSGDCSRDSTGENNPYFCTQGYCQ